MFFFMLLLPMGPLTGQQVSMTGGPAEPGRSVASAAPRPLTLLDRQLEFPRVRAAWQSKSARVAAMFRARGVHDPAEVLFRVFKHDQQLEVWVRDRESPRFVRLTTYPICRISGRLGPKRRQGDLQIPEGFYTIDVFNPQSQYHLSMRVDYPNAVDRARPGRAPLGGDIYIHGGCATIGCVPVGDESIEELYLLALQFRERGQRRIPVHIFPTRLDAQGMSWLRRTYGRSFGAWPFWQNLEEGYTLFERTRALPDVEVRDGRYVFMLMPTPSIGLATSLGG